VFRFQLETLEYSGSRTRARFAAQSAAEFLF